MATLKDPNHTFKKKLAEQIAQTQPTATNQWHTIIPKKTPTERTHIRTHHANWFHHLDIKPTDKETEEPTNKQIKVLYSETIPLPIMKMQEATSPTTPKKQKEILDKLDIAFGRPKGTT